MSYFHFDDDATAVVNEEKLGTNGKRLCELKRLHLNIRWGVVISTNLYESYLRWNDNRNVRTNELINTINRIVKELKNCPESECSVFPAKLFSLSASTSTNSSSKSIPHNNAILGMNDETFSIVSEQYGIVYALNMYANFLMRFGVLFLGVDKSEYYRILNKFKSHTDKTSNSWRDIVNSFKEVRPVPNSLFDQVIDILIIAFNCL